MCSAEQAAQIERLTSVEARLAQGALLQPALQVGYFLDHIPTTDFYPVPAAIFANYLLSVGKWFDS